jgi:thiol:disulfide interchange protein
MKRENLEATLGAVVLAALLLLVWVALGARGVWFLVWSFLVGMLVLALWQSKHKGLKVLAVVLLPFLLLGSWLSKRSLEEARRQHPGNKPPGSQ